MQVLTIRISESVYRRSRYRVTSFHPWDVDIIRVVPRPGKPHVYARHP